MSDGLMRAVWLVLAALSLLRQQAKSPRIVAATDQARAAVAELPTDLMSHALTLVVDAIEQCHYEGVMSSPGLENRWTATLIMLRLATVHEAG